MKQKLTQRPNIRVVTATEAKNRFGDIIKGVYARDEHLIVKRDGIPVAAIVPITDYERLVTQQELTDQLPENMAEEIRTSCERERAWADFRAFLARVHQRMPDVSEEEADRDIQEAIRAVRSGKIE